MFKVTLRYGDNDAYTNTCTLEDSQCLNRCDAIEMISDALKGVGFPFDGELEIVGGEAIGYELTPDGFKPIESVKVCPLSYQKGAEDSKIKWHPISELREEHKDGRWMVFESVAGIPEILRGCPMGVWINFKGDGGYYNEELFSKFLELPPLPGNKGSQQV